VRDASVVADVTQSGGGALDIVPGVGVGAKRSGRVRLPMRHSVSWLVHVQRHARSDVARSVGFHASDGDPAAAIVALGCVEPLVGVNTVAVARRGHDLGADSSLPVAVSVMGVPHVPPPAMTPAARALVTSSRSKASRLCTWVAKPRPGAQQGCRRFRAGRTSWTPASTSSSTCRWIGGSVAQRHLPAAGPGATFNRGRRRDGGVIQDVRLLPVASSEHSRLRDAMADNW
jgi:hypothetical protein